MPSPASFPSSCTAPAPASEDASDVAPCPSFYIIAVGFTSSPDQKQDMSVRKGLRTKLAARRNCTYWAAHTARCCYCHWGTSLMLLYIFFLGHSCKDRIQNDVGVRIIFVIHCHLLTCIWSREAGRVETDSGSIRLFTFKGKVHIVSISYQRIKHVWCERICELDIQGAYLQRERYVFLT